jgi:hypothetical protein
MGGANQEAWIEGRVGLLPQQPAIPFDPVIPAARLPAIVEPGAAVGNAVPNQSERISLVDSDAGFLLAAAKHWRGERGLCAE